MIEFLKGRLAEKDPTKVIIDCNGVGYLVNITLNTHAALPNEEFCKLHIHYSVSVDVRSGASTHSLFGFADKTEREYFRQLINISGVSSNTARMILSSLNPAELSQAIAMQNEVAFKSIKGIGPKLAQKIIQELTGKLNKLETSAEIFSSSNNTTQNEALSALIALGFDRQSSRKVLAKISAENANLSVEQLIKNALKQL